MNVLNIHEREIPVEIESVGPLLDSLASRSDRLWPVQAWPRMKFDRPLGVGARGGHGPVRYVVEEYVPGRRIRFRFTGPAGFDGIHELEVGECSANGSVMRHQLAMKTRGWARLTWPLVFRPLHDALIEDAFTVGEGSLGLPRHEKKWSLAVRILRRLGRARLIRN